MSRTVTCKARQHCEQIVLGRIAGRGCSFWCSFLLLRFSSNSWHLLASKVADHLLIVVPWRGLSVAVSPQRVTVVDATLLEVRFQHIFEALLVRRLAFRVEDLLSEEYTGLAFVLHGRSTLVNSWWGCFRCQLFSLLIISWRWLFCLSPSWCWGRLSKTAFMPGVYKLDGTSWEISDGDNGWSRSRMHRGALG